MSLFELAAVGAAFCWALSGILTAGPSAYLGAFAFTRIRMSMVLVMLAAVVAVSGSWRTLGAESIGALCLSGVVGIFLGDTLLFATMNRMGPRRTSILFALNAPLAVLLGWVLLGETLSGRQLAGIAVAFAGVLCAIVFGKRKSQLHNWEQVKGPLWVGVALGVGAALAQATGSLIARPSMAAGAIDPVAGSALRVGTAVVCFYVAMALPGDRFRAKQKVTLPVAAMTALSGFIAMAVGMTLLLFALKGGEVGVISTLSATSPALILPLLWLRIGEAPALGAWVGAALVIAGSALIFSA